MQVLTTASQPALTLPRSSHLNGSNLNHPHAPALEPACKCSSRRSYHLLKTDATSPRADVIKRTCSCELEWPLSPVGAAGVPWDMECGEFNRQMSA